MVIMDRNSSESSVESFDSKACSGLIHSTPVKTDCKSGNDETELTVKPLNTSTESLEEAYGKLNLVSARKSMSMDKIKIAKVVITPEKTRDGNKRTLGKNVKFSSVNKTSSSDVEKGTKKGKGTTVNLLSSSSTQASAVESASDVMSNFIDAGESLTSTLISSVNLSEPSFLSSDTSLSDEVPSQNQLGAWEKWFVKKEEDIRKKLEEKKKKEEEMKKEAARKEMEKKEKRKLEIANRKIWIARKEKEEIEKKMKEEEKKRKLDEEKRRKEEEFRKQAEENFKEWTRRKEEEKQALKDQEVANLEQTALMRRYRLEQSKIAFQEWQKRAVDRPKTAPCTFGYCGGTVVGFYDATRAPPPSFVNPMPWQSPATPNEMPSFWDTPCHHHND